MLLSYLFHGWCYFKTRQGENYSKNGDGNEKGSEREVGEKEKALQCDLISCLWQMTLYSDMFPFTASINWPEQSLPGLHCPHLSLTHTMRRGIVGHTSLTRLWFDIAVCHNVDDDSLIHKPILIEWSVAIRSRAVFCFRLQNYANMIKLVQKLWLWLIICFNKNSLTMPILLLI